MRYKPSKNNKKKVVKRSIFENKDVMFTIKTDSKKKYEIIGKDVSREGGEDDTALGGHTAE